MPEGVWHGTQCVRVKSGDFGRKKVGKTKWQIQQPQMSASKHNENKEGEEDE